MLRNRNFLHKNNHFNISNKKNYHKHYNFNYIFIMIFQYNFHYLKNNVHYNKYSFNPHYKIYNLQPIFQLWYIFLNLNKNLLNIIYISLDSMNNNYHSFKHIFCFFHQIFKYNYKVNKYFHLWIINKIW